jgi:colanic acid/amylovoran biosynthesis glycosyltransferase
MIGSPSSSRFPARPTALPCSPLLTAVVKRGRLGEPFIWDSINSLRRYRPVLAADGFDERVEWPAERVSLGGMHPPSLVGRLLRTMHGEERHPFGVSRRAYARKALRALSDDVDVIHAHYGPTGVWCLNELGLNRPALVTTFYCYDLFAEGKYPWWQAAYKRLGRESDLILVLSDYIREFVLEAGWPEERVEVDRLGVDLRMFPYRPPRDTDSPVILCVSNFQPKKGLIYLVRAFAAVARRHDGVRLRLLGSGEQEARIHAEVERLRISDRVEFRAPVSYRDLPGVYADADIFCLPSVMSTDFDLDEISMVIVQSLATGLPVISTHHAGIAEIVRSGYNGELAEERSVESLAAAIDRVLSDPKRWSEIGHAGRRSAEEFFDLQRHGEALERRYDLARARRSA